MIKAVLIDLDNTLLETQALYTAAETDLLRLILAHTDADPGEVADDIQRRKLMLFDRFGYDPAMLPRAFEEALIYFVPAASDNDILQARALGCRIFEEEARLKEGAEDAIRQLAEHFVLYLVTVGDQDVQRRRIDTLPFRELFCELFIVPDKTPETYLAVLEHGKHAPHEAVMIGDSLKSDILPAVEAGLNAIHIPAENWHGREMQGLELPAQENVVRHCSLREAANFLAGAQPETPATAPRKAPQSRRTPGPRF